MSLKKYDLNKKEDALVFKAFIRCLKEERKIASKSLYGYKGFRAIIDRCYASRLNHPGEDFQTNICYWPEDSGGLFSNHITKLLYIALIIKFLKPKKIKGLGVKFKEIYSCITNGVSVVNSSTPEILAYSQDLINAFIACGEDEENAKLKVKLIECCVLGIKNKIPF